MSQLSPKDLATKNTCRGILNSCPPGSRTKEQIDGILAYLLSANVLPVAMDEDEVLMKLCQEMKLINMDQNSILFVQGQPATSYFITFSGAIDILQTRDSCKALDILRTYHDKLLKCLGTDFNRGSLGIHLTRLPENKGFGELALIKEGATRAASAFASQPSEMIEIGPELYAETLKPYHIDQANVGETFEILRELHLCKGLPGRALTKVAYQMQSVSFPLRAKICSEGAPIERVILIQAGEAKELKLENKVQIEVATKGKGMLIGGVDLLRGSLCYSCSYVASTTIEAFTMPLDAFDILRSNTVSAQKFLKLEQARSKFHTERGKPARAMKKNLKGDHKKFTDLLAHNLSGFDNGTSEDHKAVISPKAKTGGGSLSVLNHIFNSECLLQRQASPKSYKVAATEQSNATQVSKNNGAMVLTTAQDSVAAAPVEFNIKPPPCLKPDHSRENSCSKEGSRIYLRAQSVHYEKAKAAQSLGAHLGLKFVSKTFLGETGRSQSSKNLDQHNLTVDALNNLLQSATDFGQKQDVCGTETKRECSGISVSSASSAGNSDVDCKHEAIVPQERRRMKDGLFSTINVSRAHSGVRNSAKKQAKSATNSPKEVGNSKNTSFFFREHSFSEKMQMAEITNDENQRPSSEQVRRDKVRFYNNSKEDSGGTLLENTSNGTLKKHKEKSQQEHSSKGSANAAHETGMANSPSHTDSLKRIHSPNNFKPHILQESPHSGPSRAHKDKMSPNFRKEPELASPNPGHDIVQNNNTNRLNLKSQQKTHDSNLQLRNPSSQNTISQPNLSLFHQNEASTLYNLDSTVKSGSSEKKTQRNFGHDKPTGDTSAPPVKMTSSLKRSPSDGHLYRKNSVADKPGQKTYASVHSPENVSMFTQLNQHHRNAPSHNGISQHRLSLFEVGTLQNLDPAINSSMEEKKAQKNSGHDKLMDDSLASPIKMSPNHKRSPSVGHAYQKHSVEKLGGKTYTPVHSPENLSPATQTKLDPRNMSSQNGISLKNCGHDMPMVESLGSPTKMSSLLRSPSDGHICSKKLGEKTGGKTNASIHSLEISSMRDQFRKVHQDKIAIQCPPLQKQVTGIFVNCIQPSKVAQRTALDMHPAPCGQNCGIVLSRNGV